MNQSPHMMRASFASGQPCAVDAFIDAYGPITDSHGSYLVDEQTARGSAATHVWTQVDCEGQTCLIPGFHYVNRTGSYVVTTSEWMSGDEEVIENLMPELINAPQDAI